MGSYSTADRLKAGMNPSTPKSQRDPDNRTLICRLTDGLHYLIACVDALSAMDAFQLQSVSNVDPGWANSGATTTVHAIPNILTGYLIKR